MSLLADAEDVPISEAASRGVSKLAAAAEAGHATVLRRHSVPVAAVIGYGDLQRLSSLERDLTDVALILARTATDTGNRTALDDVIESLGFTRDELNSLDDPA